MKKTLRDVTYEEALIEGLRAEGLDETAIEVLRMWLLLPREDKLAMIEFFEARRVKQDSSLGGQHERKTLHPRRRYRLPLAPDRCDL